MLIGIINWSKKMIQYKSGNILDEKTQAIVNTVNCVGVMGRRNSTGIQKPIS